MPRSQSSISSRAPARRAPAAAAAAAPTALPALPHRGERPARSPPPAGLSDGRPRSLSHTGPRQLSLSARGGERAGKESHTLPHLKEPALRLADGKMMMLKPFRASELFFIVRLSSLFLPSPLSSSLSLPFSSSSSSSSSRGWPCSRWGWDVERGHPWRFSIRDRLEERRAERWQRRHQGRWKGPGQGSGVLLEPAATRALPTNQPRVLTIRTAGRLPCPSPAGLAAASLFFRLCRALVLPSGPQFLLAESRET